MRLDQSSMDISTLTAKVNSGELDLQPDFQRGQVWTDAKKKRLIDTILRSWYVPAIHIIVNDELDHEEVLDGQQRLRTILEFMDNRFSIDGMIEPIDHAIKALNGMYYTNLPDPVRSRFRRFTITTVRLRDYEPEEPGELFFRLNQLTALTAAEQRNALVGEPRNQVRKLATKLEEHFNGKSLGFSNSRMNVDDVLSRLALSIEMGTLFEKITASRLEMRYRKGFAFSKETTSLIEQSIYCLATGYDDSWFWKQNKATLFSWLYFIADNAWARHSGNHKIFATFFNGFEASRSSSFSGYEYLTSPGISSELYSFSSEIVPRVCARIFNDRSSSRVNDVSSVVLRDISLNVAYLIAMPKSALINIKDDRLTNTLLQIALQIEEAGDELDFGEQSLLEGVMIKIWERFNEAREAK